MLETSFCSFFGLFEESFCTLWEWLDQTSITSLVVQEVLIRTVSLFGCQSEWILSFCFQLRVEGEQIPVSSLNSFLHLILAVVHTTLSDTVELTWSITNNQGWSVISFLSLIHICALKRSRWSIGSFNSEYAFAISQPFMKNSKRST